MRRRNGAGAGGVQPAVAVVAVAAAGGLPNAAKKIKGQNCRIYEPLKCIIGKFIEELWQCLACICILFATVRCKGKFLHFHILPFHFRKDPLFFKSDTLIICNIFVCFSWKNQVTPGTLF